MGKLDPKLESYLNALDRALSAFPTSERAEIVTEMKSHVLEALDREPTRNITNVLESIGEPETVANKYLLERGLKPGKPSRSPIVKWLTVGFLGTFGITVLAVLVLLWKFSPILSISDDRVSILGGTIEIDGKEGTLAVGTTRMAANAIGKGARQLKGSKPIPNPGKIGFQLRFTNGKAEVRRSVDETLRWECEYFGDEDSMVVSEKGPHFGLLAEKAAGVDCEVELPKGMAIDIQGTNGAVEIERPSATTLVKLSNGQVSLNPTDDGKYKYDLKVKVGTISEGFVTSAAGKDVIPVSVDLGNGQILRE